MPGLDRARHCSCCRLCKSRTWSESWVSLYLAVPGSLRGRGAWLEASWKRRVGSLSGSSAVRTPEDPICGTHDEIEKGSPLQEWCTGGRLCPGAVIQERSLCETRSFGYPSTWELLGSCPEGHRGGPEKGKGCTLMYCPFLMRLVQGLCSWVEHLACWAPVHLGASAVCPSTQFSHLMEETIGLEECLFGVCCEQSPM